ncbi:hypothetical protein ACP0GC_25055, partial [Escherichia coli]
MIKLYEKGMYLSGNNEIIAEDEVSESICKEEAKKGTIAWS